MSKLLKGGIMHISLKKVKIFKIINRKGYGCICMNNLTEGKTFLEAYSRMIKAMKRNGDTLDDLGVSDLKKMIINI